MSKTSEKIVEKLDASLGELRNELSDLKGRVSSLESLQKRIDKLADNLENQQNLLKNIEREQSDLKDWVSKLDEEVNENNIFRRRITERITEEDTEKVLPEKFKNE